MTHPFKLAAASSAVALLLICNSVQANTKKAEFKGAEQINLNNWQLIWEDDFNYANEKLEQNWISQNGPTENIWVLGSRWRDNAVVKDGVLHLINRKETRGGQDWTSGNVWTKQTFGYGYFEAKFKYAGAYGTNNSFWFWPKNGTPKGNKACEIDINEGHYPNIINTNVHNWTDTYTLPSGRVAHEDNQKHWTLIGNPNQSIVLDKPVKAQKIRLTSNNPSSIHISEFAVLAPSDSGYPIAGKPLDTQKWTNHTQAEDAQLKTNGIFNKLPSKPEYAIDGRLDTRWVSAKSGKKWLEISWPEARAVGAVQFVNGWKQEYGDSTGFYRNLMSDYTLEYYDGQQWQTLSQYNSAEVADFSEEYHTFGLQWDEDYFRFYLDGELYHTMRNKACFTPTNILFSLAILKADIAGPVTDAIDGTSMKVDWVRYYQKKP